jgi:hypothetical protein
VALISRTDRSAIAGYMKRLAVRSAVANGKASARTEESSRVTLDGIR